MRRVLAFVGATATGKTALGEAAAEEVGGEIVCADARQVFRELDIGTGKPTAAELAARPHHLFDALGLGDAPSAGWYGRLAHERCEELLARGVTPVLVGGSGLYLRALMEGLHAEPPRDAAVCARLRAELEALGPEPLHARLATVDPPTAARLHERDRQRIVRSLEVYEASGKPLSWWHEHAERVALRADWSVVELTCEPPLLAERIERRTRSMFEAGLLEETRALLESGRRDALRSLKAIGYDEAMAVLEGRLSCPDAIALTSQRTRQMAKRQRTWFRHQVQAVRVEGGERSLPDVLADCRRARDPGPRSGPAV